MNAILLLIALTSLSTSPLWVRLASAPIATICAWRLLGAAGIVALASMAKGRSLAWSDREERKYSLWASVFFFAHIWTYVYSAQNTSVSHLVLIFCSAPIFTAIGATIWMQEPFPRRLWFVDGLALIGLYLLFTDPQKAISAQAQSTSLAGDLMAVVSAVLHAAYALCSKQARKKAENLRFSFWLYGVSGIIFLALLMPQATVNPADLIPTHLNFYWGILGLIALPSFLGHSLFTYLVKLMNINVLSCSKLLEPVIAGALAYVLFQEQVGIKTLFAFIILGLAVLVLFLPWQKQNDKRKSAVSESKV